MPSGQGRQHWNLGDLVLLKMLPEDAWWPMWFGAPDGLVRGDDEVRPEVVDGFGEGLVHHLKRVDRGGQHHVWPKHAGLDQEGNLQVRESSPLADPSAFTVTATLPQTIRSTDGS
jgi:hypothetical protein